LPGTDVWYARPRRYRPGGLKLFSASKCDPARLRSNVSWWRPDCVAGHVRLELRNVDTNYPFERSHRFAGIQPNSGFGDYSRLSGLRFGIDARKQQGLPSIFWRAFPRLKIC